MKTSATESVDGYLDLCLESSKNDELFNNFKSNPTVQIVLEHVDRALGHKYLDCIVSDNLIMDNIEAFKINDKLGSPKMFTYYIGDFSPTTLRYCKVLSDVNKIDDLDGKNVIEIGCGYGGQYTVIRQAKTPESYTFVDLEEPNALIERYVNELELNDIELNYINGSNDNATYKEEYDMVISNYAISECYESIQEFYINNICAKSKHGYITNNQLRGHKLDKFVELLNDALGKEVIVSREEPLSGRNNYIITW